MSIAAPFLILLIAGLVAAYHRWPLFLYVLATAVALAAGSRFGVSTTATIAIGVVFALVVIPLLIPAVRLPWITRPLLDFYTKLLPPLSDTERTALEAGTVGFEGELFSGKPKWKTLLTQHRLKQLRKHSLATCQKRTCIRTELPNSSRLTNMRRFAQHAQPKKRL